MRESERAGRRWKVRGASRENIKTVFTTRGRTKGGSSQVETNL